MFVREATYTLYTKQVKSVVGNMICKYWLFGLNCRQEINRLLQVNTVFMIGFEVYTAVEIRLFVL
jgi:hypothetical protein